MRVFFDLFLFTTGYKVGPQFFRGLKKDALPQVAVTLVLCVTCLLGRLAAAKVFGTTWGRPPAFWPAHSRNRPLSGLPAMPIDRLASQPRRRRSLINNIPVAYAVTYLIGTAFVVWFLPNVGPKLMGVNLKEEGRKLQAQIAGSDKSARPRGCRLSSPGGARLPRHRPDWLNKRGRMEAPQKIAVFILGSEGRARSSRSIRARWSLRATFARFDTLRTAHGSRADVGTEVSDKELLDIPIEFLDVVITNKALVGKTLAELAAMDFAGVFLKKLSRTGKGCRSLLRRGWSGAIADSVRLRRRRAGGQGPRLPRPSDR